LPEVLPGIVFVLENINCKAMKKTLILLMISLLLVSSHEIKAQKLNASEQKRVDEVFKKGQMAYFKFPISSTQEIPPLTKIITVDKKEGRMVFAHTNKEGFSKFILKGYPYTIIKVTSPPAKTKKKKK
jgi:hypothetical protein